MAARGGGVELPLPTAGDFPAAGKRTLAIAVGQRHLSRGWFTPWTKKVCPEGLKGQIGEAEQKIRDSVGTL